MRTTVNLEPEAYRLARALASQREVSVGQILSEALINQFQKGRVPSKRVEVDKDGFPALYLGRVITPDEVAGAIQEE